MYLYGCSITNSIYHYYTFIEHPKNTKKLPIFTKVFFKQTFPPLKYGCVSYAKTLLRNIAVLSPLLHMARSLKSLSV